jgi:hypothetical protein
MFLWITSVQVLMVRVASKARTMMNSTFHLQPNLARAATLHLLTPKAHQWPNFGHCYFGDLL